MSAVGWVYSHPAPLSSPQWNTMLTNTSLPVIAIMYIATAKLRPKPSWVGCIFGFDKPKPITQNPNHVPTYFRNMVYYFGPKNFFKQKFRPKSFLTTNFFPAQDFWPKIFMPPHFLPAPNIIFGHKYIFPTKFIEEKKFRSNFFSFQKWFSAKKFLRPVFQPNDFLAILVD